MRHIRYDLAGGKFLELALRGTAQPFRHTPLDSDQQSNQHHVDSGGGEREQSGDEEPPRRTQLDRLVKGELQACRHGGTRLLEALSCQRIEVGRQDREERAARQADDDPFVECESGHARRGHLVHDPIDQPGRHDRALGGCSQEDGRPEFGDRTVCVDQRRWRIGRVRGARRVPGGLCERAGRRQIRRCSLPPGRVRQQGNHEWGGDGEGLPSHMKHITESREFTRGSPRGRKSAGAGGATAVPENPGEPGPAGASRSREKYTGHGGRSRNRDISCARTGKRDLRRDS